MNYEYLTYADLKDLSLESLSINEKSVKAVFRHASKPKVSIGVEYNRAIKTSSISYPSGVSAAQVIIHNLETCVKEISKKLEKLIENK